MTIKGSIGVFDSGYGGLTVLREFVKHLPQYDYLYLGDNARAPYGNRSFDTVHQYTLQCVRQLFDMGCPIVILACNTASAKALRTIQQKDLPLIDPAKRVLGVIRPTTEIVGKYSKTGHIGVFATAGTVASDSYVVEIKKFYPHMQVVQEACPMWVPLVENNEFDNPGADYYIKQHIQNLLHKDTQIDTIVLGCTHYPLLAPKIKSFLPEHITLLSQGELVSNSLKDYLHRHTEIKEKLTVNNTCRFYTTDDADTFNKNGSLFFGHEISATHLALQM
ncbi:MAG: glutamate racemase [Bacteroidota bacterium]|jgi:glutamate racemase|nr:glutamate racemase [Sphingobacteriales bacterium]